MRDLSSAAEKRWHESLRPWLGQSGEIVALTRELDGQWYGLICFGEQGKKLMRLQAGGSYETGQMVQVHLGRFTTTEDKRILYHLVGQKV